MKPLRISAARVLCLVVWQIGFAPKASNANVNHLVPVSETAAEAYQAKLHAKLSVTPADIAQMIVGLAWEPEFAVSVYSDLPTSNDDIVRYHVTVTRAATSIWYSPGAVEIRRSDAELPASAALPIKEVWKQMLLSTRPYKNPVDLPVDGETVEFALLEPNQSALRGELPVNPAGDILALRHLGTLLVDYGQATASEQKALANKIEKTAKRLLKRKPDLEVVRLRDSLSAESAPKELVGLYSKDPDLRNLKKVRYWKQESDASDLIPTRTLAVISNAKGQSPDHLPLGDPPPQYRIVIKDNPTELRFDLMLISSDNRPLCVSVGGWPDGLGHVDWGSSWVKLNSKSRFFPARDWNFGYCEGNDCSHRVGAIGTLTGFIGYAEFGDPKEISALSERRLLFETSAYVCPPTSDH